MDDQAPIFRDRHQAGRILARRLTSYANRPDVTVLGLPRGGVPVAYEVARALDAPLGCFVVRKLGAPGHPELAMGAVATGGTIVVNDETVEALGIPDELIQREAAEELREIARQEQVYNAEVPPVSIAGRTVILVDDGLATGATMRAALAALARQSPARSVVAVPVAAPPTYRELASMADDFVCVATPEPFFAVGEWYESFEQVGDAEVRSLLREGARLPRRGAGDRRHRDLEIPPADEAVVEIPVPGAELRGDLVVPEGARGIVVFAHGSGSSRHSPRNQFVAELLEREGFATLLFNLLTPREEEEEWETGHYRFDINLLAERLARVTDWLGALEATRGLPVGYFGASTGGAAALVAAVKRPLAVGAIVVRGGRPDLAGNALYRVRTPTLLVVGSSNPVVLDLNRDALEKLGAHKRLDVVPGATHLFEEPGALELVAERASRWFAAHLARPGRASEGVEGPPAPRPSPA